MRHHNKFSILRCANTIFLLINTMHLIKYLATFYFCGFFVYKGKMISSGHSIISRFRVLVNMKILFLLTFIVTVLVIYSEQSEPICSCICRGAHEIYSECGSACPEICNTPQGICIQVCVKGCFCEEGYVLRSNTSDECILKSSCDPPAA